MPPGSRMAMPQIAMGVLRRDCIDLPLETPLRV
jgi:hypothetical protein